MSKPHKIVKLGLEKTVHELRNQGLGYQAISKVLEEQHGVKISFMSIKRYFEAINIPIDTPKIREEIVNGKIDNLKRLEITIERLQELSDKALRVNKVDEFLKIIKEMRGWIELLTKIQGDLQETPTTVVWNVVKVGTCSK
ncbi:hypothetical protein DRO97_06465 [Archaeoglobales archaeon]|nr:MAG: hypothetical protein DRO97_06465 [Archaeoglobales archaeon]